MVASAVASPLTRELRAWYGNPKDQTAQIANSFQRFLGKKITDVVPQSVTIIRPTLNAQHSNAIRTHEDRTGKVVSDAGGGFVANTGQNPSARKGRHNHHLSAERVQVTGPVSRTSQHSRKASTGVSAVTPMTLDKLRVSSTTPNTEHLTVLLTQLLLEMDMESGGRSWPRSNAAAHALGGSEIEKMGEELTSTLSSKNRRNVLTPSKQKRLHQYVVSFGSNSSAILKACEQAASASNGAAAARAMERDFLRFS